MHIFYCNSKKPQPVIDPKMADGVKSLMGSFLYLNWKLSWISSSNSNTEGQIAFRNVDGLLLRWQYIML